MTAENTGMTELVNGDGCWGGVTKNVVIPVQVGIHEAGH